MRLFNAAAALLFAGVAAAPAPAMMTFIFAGTVTEQLKPGQDPFVTLGEAVTVTVQFDPATLYPYPFGSDRLMIPKEAPASMFNVRTAGGLEWRATDEYLDAGIPIRVDGSYLSFSGFLNRPGTSSLPDMGIGASGGVGSFSIQSSNLYGNSTQTLGFRGQIRQVFAIVPEPATWALMIVGFGAVGGAARRRRVHHRVRPGGALVPVGAASLS